MRKYKVGDVIKFKDLSDVTEGFTFEHRNIPLNILKTISRTVNTIEELMFEKSFKVVGCGFIFNEEDLESITPQQKQHILQLIREI